MKTPTNSSFLGILAVSLFVIGLSDSLAAPIQEINATVYAGEKGPRDVGHLTMTLVNNNGQEITFPMRGYPAADILGSSESADGRAGFAFGSAFLTDPASSGAWEVSNIRYYRFQHHCPGGVEWRIGSINIRVWTTEGEEVELDNVRFDPGPKINRGQTMHGYHFGGRGFDDSHRIDDAALHTTVSMTVETGHDDLRNRAYARGEVELVNGEIVQTFQVFHRLDSGESHTLLIQLPLGADVADIHRCRLLMNGTPWIYGGSEPDTWHLNRWTVTAAEPGGATTHLHERTDFSLTGLQGAESPSLNPKRLFDFKTNRFLLMVGTGADDLRGDVHPESELRALLHLVDGSTVPLLIPYIERLRPWRRVYLEAVTEGGREVALSEILGYSVTAVRRGHGTTHPQCPVYGLEGVVDDPFRGDDEWDFVCSSLSAAPIHVPHPIALPESTAHLSYYLSNIVPYPTGIQTLVRVNWSEAEERFGFHPTPGWVRLHSAHNLDDRQTVREGVNPRAQLLGPFTYETTTLVQLLAAAGWLEGMPFMFSLTMGTDEAIVIDESTNQDAAEHEFEDPSADSAPEFQITLPEWRRHAYGPIAMAGLEDSDGDGSSDEETYAYGLRNGASLPLTVRSGNGEVLVAFPRNRDAAGLQFQVWVSSDCGVWADRTPSTAEVSSVPGRPELEMVKYGIPHDGEFDRQAFVKIGVGVGE